MMTYLVDTSAWAQIEYDAKARDRFAGLARVRDLAVCPVVAGEVLYSSRSYADLREDRGFLEDLPWLETTDDAQERALGVQQQLARQGQHRGVGMIDLLVAATAEAHWATVLHYDRDFERIAEVTGQPHEWIVARGEGHDREETR